ncbi:MAG: arylamine N-acetyltransferase [Moraxellaceae bacterium]|nr:MAG: arylamine N-acetyltransferase [Moraxellaceae bacterium]
MVCTKKFESYFNRLNVDPQQLSLILVEEIQKKHIAEFCFNSLAVLLGRPISLDIEDIIGKFVLQNQGGYCFEHNKLIHDALDALGFSVRCLIAKMINNQDIDSPRTHRICLLEWQNEQYLIDVGLGANCPRKPIKIEAGLMSIQNDSSYRIVVNSNQDFQLELATGNGFFSLYTFNLNRYTEADCIMSNFYSSKHPDAVFVNNLVMSRILPEVTLSLRNDQYHRIGINHTDVIQISDYLQLQKIIKQDFDIELSEDESKTLYLKTCT